MPVMSGSCLLFETQKSFIQNNYCSFTLLPSPTDFLTVTDTQLHQSTTTTVITLTFSLHGKRPHPNDSDSC